MEIILDVGSGNSLPDIETAKKVVDAITVADNHKHTLTLKAQLFREALPNLPLSYYVFYGMYAYAAVHGYKLTASVFDKKSLKHLLTFDVPFVKIANRRDLDWLIGEVPRRIPIYQSLSPRDFWVRPGDNHMLCVSKYPALIEDYQFPTDSFIANHE